MGFLEDKVYELLNKNKVTKKEVDKLNKEIISTSDKYTELLDTCGAKLTKCDRCDGKGFTVSTSGYGGVNTDIDDCTKCKGTGKIIVSK